MRPLCQRCHRISPRSCSRQNCPFFAGRKHEFKKEFSGQAPSIFIGSYGYPDVRVGFLATEHDDEHDAPDQWTKKNTPIPTIIDKRSELVNSQFLANVTSFSDRFLEQAQLVAQTDKAADVEIQLEKTPQGKIAYPRGLTPHGASETLIQSRLTSNVHIPKRVDKIVSETHLKANSAIQQLYGKISTYNIPKLLSGGLLGEANARKLVPTRWAITATDDTISKQQLETIRDCPPINEHELYFGGLYGNYYLILLFPEKWQYELIETLTYDAKDNKHLWQDYEGYAGRTKYAQETAGGYYATRLGITDHLSKRKRQAAVLAIRFITEEYTHPLGVWVPRESAKQALNAQKMTFNTEEEMWKYAAAKTRMMKMDLQPIKQASLLQSAKKQKSIIEWF